MKPLCFDEIQGLDSIQEGERLLSRDNCYLPLLPLPAKTKGCSKCEHLPTTREYISAILPIIIKDLFS